MWSRATAVVTAGLCLSLSSSVAEGAEGKAVTVAKGVSVTFPADWIVRSSVAERWSAEHLDKKKQTEASMVVQVETRADHAEALARLGGIEAEYPGGVKYSLIGGWPAVERSISVKFERPGEGGGAQPGGETALQTTTAVAAGNLLVRVDTRLQPTAPAALADRALAIGRGIKLPAAPAGAAEELKGLQTGKHRPHPPARPRTYAPAGGGAPAKLAPQRTPTIPGGAGSLIGGAGEIEAAVSGDGSRMLTSARCIVSLSRDFGATFTVSTVKLGGFPTDGDCSLAWAQSGAFYLSELGAATNLGGVYSIGVASSVDGGKTFNLAAVLVSKSLFDIVDQPHIAADRLTRSSLARDSVYLVFQEGFTFEPSITCSRNGGTTWSAPKAANGGVLSYPRVAVGGDGMVYVVSRSGTAAVIDKFSNCDGGLARAAGFPVAQLINPGPCPVPGLDRCNNGNWLASPTIAVDDTNPMHVYLGWANWNGAGEDILIADSTDGGKHFGTPIAVNSAVKTRRFLPWLAVWGGVAHVGWYDRRRATPTKNDLTRYFRGSAFVVGGILVPGLEVDLSGVSDPQCASGFVCGVRDAADCLSCSAPPAPGMCGTNPMGGCPKYGDYNGDAAGGGRVLHVWASATGPGLPPKAPISAFTTVTTFCGAAGRACCPAGTACDAGLVCGGSTTCVPCGDAGDPCCPTNKCNGALVCAGNQCECGGTNQPCCDPGATCGSNLVCSTNHQCECGGVDQPCCAQNGANSCNDPSLVCDPRTFLCTTSCGHRFQACCQNGVCNAALTCAGGVCSCGAKNQPCCLAGASCAPSLTCASGHCVGAGSPCGDCTKNRASCKAGCAKSDSLCICRCDSAFCTCSNDNGCGPCGLNTNCTQL